jgi:hypothetical protein
MKLRIIALTAALAAMFIAMACGGAANTNTTSNTAGKSNSQADAAINSNANVVVNSAGNSVMIMNKNGVTVSIENPPNKPKSNVNFNTTPPKGATYQCRDGSYSTGNQDSTACSGHDGVQKPLTNTPPK